MQLVGETVVAESGTQWDWDFLALPGNLRGWVPKWGFKTQAPTYDPRFDIGGQFGGWHYGVKAYGGYGGEVGSDGEAQRGPDVNEYCDFAGVLGTGIYVTGVAGTSVNNIGVYAQTGADRPQLLATDDTAAVLGASNSANAILGLSTSGSGVWSASAYSVASFALSYQESGVLGVSSTFGPTTLPMNIPTIAGVWGTSDQSPGVIGTSNKLMGIYGFSTGNAGIVGQTANPNSFAGYFAGNLVVTGTKSAAVPFPDGTQRALYCMESPELWFEDFGMAKLKRGRAAIKLDADFAKVIKRGDYRVFITPEGDSRGLYVRRKTAAGFEVRESQGGKSSIAFSYRIVGRRKDIAGARRFARVTPPALPGGPPRKRAPTAAELHAFVTGLARLRRAKGGRKGRTPRALPKGLRRSGLRRPAKR
jgi:hypothetical protein